MAENDNVPGLLLSIRNALLTVGGGPAARSSSDLDTQGNPVPTHRAHTFTYDASGNLATDSVTDGTNTWTRTYTYMGGNQVSDSGWVKQ